jgi:hypothetical protein
VDSHANPTRRPLQEHRDVSVIGAGCGSNRGDRRLDALPVLQLRQPRRRIDLVAEFVEDCLSLCAAFRRHVSPPPRRCYGTPPLLTHTSCQLGNLTPGVGFVTQLQNSRSILGLGDKKSCRLVEQRATEWVLQTAVQLAQLQVDG